MEESMDEWDPEEETYYKCHLDGSENSFLYLAELCLQGFSPFSISIRCKDFSQGEECSACVKMPSCPLQECLPICEVNLRGKDQIKQGLHWSPLRIFNSCRALCIFFWCASSKPKQACPQGLGSTCPLGQEFITQSNHSTNSQMCPHVPFPAEACQPLVVHGVLCAFLSLTVHMC